MKRKILVPMFASFMALSINSVAFADQDVDKTNSSTETQDNGTEEYKELSFKVADVKEGTAVKIRKVGQVQDVAYEGDSLKVIGQQGEWLKVKLDEETVGWAPARYLELKNATAYINAEKVNFRSEPNIESELYDELELADSIKVIEEQGNWIKIEVDGKEGYIRSLYISEEKPEIEEEQTEEAQPQKTQETSRSTSNRVSSNVSKQTSAKEEVRTQINTNYSSSKASSIINTAYSKMGKPYVWGAEGPNSFDCSGFTSYAFRHGAGISLPRTSIAQAGVGVSVSKGQLQPGDLVFFDSDRDGDISHVGIYVGGGQFIHASSSKGVTVSSLNSAFYSSVYKGAKRVL
jgi:cell wall-associated NlpC family hydrolase